MNNCTLTTRKNQAQVSLYILSQRLDLLRAGTINWRECRLLALLDQGMNSYKHRRTNDPKPRPKYITRSTDELHRRLGFAPGNTGQSVKCVLEGLAAKGLLKFRSSRRGWWAIKVRPIDQRDGLLIPPWLEKLFVARKITIGEEFILARISSFTLKGMPCYLTNRSLDEQFASQQNTVFAQRVIAGLRRKGLLVPEVLTNEELAVRLAEHAEMNDDTSTYRPRHPHLSARLLWPLLEHAYCGRTLWDIAPQSVQSLLFPDEPDDDEW